MNDKTAKDDDVNRRSFLSNASNTFMVGGLASSYGTFVYCAGKYLMPTRAADLGEWQFLATAEELRDANSMTYRSPSGVNVVVASHGDANEDKFLALSSVCPHLGCMVHWESQNDRFFCPCHNGVFDRRGVATEGPPASAKQSLTEFPVKVENGLVYVRVPTENVTDGGPSGEGVERA